MMCLKTFTEKYSKDFDNWNDYIYFVNENIRYAKTKSKVNDFKGKCEPHELPSYHPYWSLVVRLGYRKLLFKTIENYNKCEEDIEQLKYLYNHNTSLKNLRERIEKYKNIVYKRNPLT